MLKIVTGDAERDNLTSSLDELVAEGACRMLIAGLETEVADYIARHEALIDEAGLVWSCVTAGQMNARW